MQALARRAAAPVFTLALFSSAALIFVLQPLFTRMTTPLLGGSPAVWNTSMAFFQGALLVGYVYAHLLARLKDLKQQALIHGVALIAAFFVLPVQVTDLVGPPSSDHPAIWLLGVLTLSVGAPFAIASATAPLLQAWYARTGRADAHDPYYLYAASNLGSFGGLLAYPILIEPLLGAQAQSAAWSGAYGVVALLILACAGAAIFADGSVQTMRASSPQGAISWRQRGLWMAAAAVPSVLSLGVTQHISTDVASAPMLWVVPLALYLLTFVIAFAKGAERFSRWVTLAYPFAMALLIMSFLSRGNWAGALTGVLVGFFMSALVCHMTLARTRPPAAKLTEFYFWVSLGGVLGGAFAAFLAPVIFSGVYEFPLALAAAAFFAPRGALAMPRLADVALAGCATLTGVALLLMHYMPQHAVIIGAAIGAAGGAVAASWGDEVRPAPLRYAHLIVSTLLGVAMIAISFTIDAAFIEPEGADGPSLAGPWQAAALGLGFFALTFAVHGSMQKRRASEGRLDIIGDIGLGVAIPPVLLLIVMTMLGPRLDADTIVVVALGLCALSLFVNRGRPWAMGAILILAFVILHFNDTRDFRVTRQERSFFGVVRTIEYAHPEEIGLPVLRVLMHGTTIHGAQLIGPDVARQPLTYYHPDTALGESIVAGLSTGDTSSLALIGLGAGATACLMAPRDTLTVFEIDPAVVRLSNTPEGDFTYVPECAPDARMVIGDGRLQIANEPDGSFDVIVVDAFSSDAVPAHLLTREALALYLSKLSDRGIVILHLSNRNLALVSESARVAASLNAPTLWRISERVEVPAAPVYGGLPASVMIVARDPAVLGFLPLRSDEWRVFEAPPGRPWSDDYINLPRAMWDNLTGVEECRQYPGLERCAAEKAVKE